MVARSSGSGQFAIFDLETDGIEGDIIEVGAVLCSGPDVLYEFESLVHTHGPLQPDTARLTHLSDADLADSPSLRDVLLSFCDFVGTKPLIAHNGFGFDFRKLDEAARSVGLDPPPGTRLDTLELAHLVFPRAGEGMIRDSQGGHPPPGRKLEHLADWFHLEYSVLHRALTDSRLTHKVMLAMLEVLDRDEPSRQLQRWIMARGAHPWAGLIRTPDNPPDLADVVPPPLKTRRDQPSGQFDIDALERAFQAGGVLMAEREPRPPQMQMAQAVATALSNGGQRLIEAPTGTGKTLAYVVPAIEYARSSGRTVAVSTFSHVLQSQILSTLEELEQEIGRFNWVLLKGRHNYVSLEALEAELDEDPPDVNTALALAVICGWAAETPTGDWEDLRTTAIDRRVRALDHLRWKLRVEHPPGPAFTALDERDFYRRAREGLRTAHIAVLNHALLVVSDFWRTYGKHAVIDEAHQLEDAATSALSEEVGSRYLADLSSAVASSSGASVVRRLRRALPWSELDETTRTAYRSVLDDLQTASENVKTDLRNFGEELIGYVRIRTGAQQAQTEKYGASYHIRSGIDTGHSSYHEVVRRAKVLQMALIRLADTFNRISVPGRLRGRYRQRRLQYGISRLGRAARNAAKLIDQVVWAEDQEVWVNIVDLRLEEGTWSWTLRRAPASVAPQLGDLWKTLNTVVLTSATLTVNGSFGFLIRALGLEGPQTSRLPTPFDRLKQNHLVLYTDYLPAPRGGLLDEFGMAEASEIPRLFVLTHGRGLALMTARARLEQVRDHASPYMEKQGLILLAQGDGSPAALAERMRAEVSTSLLALRSFWEGIDIPGEALSLLVIEKIPFDSPGDPVVSARMGALELQGKDPFADYLIPRAALRFTQGVGRLIRTNHDVGVTVILDSRLCRPTPYRDRIRRSLSGPPTSMEVDSAEHAYAEIAGHLGIDLDESLWKRLRDIRSADRWSRFRDIEDLRLKEEDLADAERIRGTLERCREWFGFKEWRPGQLETIVRFIRGEDVLAVLPTGSGKSLTFQLTALLAPGVTLVISPLKALMNDQVENLRARGVGAVAAIHSGVPQGEQQEILAGARQGRYKLLYVSPERLWNPMFTRMLEGVEIGRIAVDEAHCIAQWGHSFRPEYSAIPKALLQAVGDSRHKPVLAATATATSRTRKEIRKLLQLESGARVITASPDRPEIRYYVEHCDDSTDRDVRVLQILDAFRLQSSIVYVPRIKDTTRLAGLVRSAGHTVRPYHGGLPSEERLHVEDAYRHGEVDVVVATKAFGMGIDKPDIALIIHLEMPASIEEYMQETGRVARGATVGLGPECGTAVLLVTPGDCRIHRFFADSASPDLVHVKKMWSGLRMGVNYIPPDPVGDRDRANPGRESVALAVHYLQQSGSVERREDVIWRGRVSVVDDTRERIEKLSTEDPALGERAAALVRMCDESDSGTYHAEDWGKRLSRRPSGVGADLLELNRRGILGFVAFEYALTLVRAADVEPDWAVIETTAERQRSVARERSTEALRFARDQRTCRRKVILDYLGISAPDRCRGCTSCVDLPRPWAKSKLTRDSILGAIPVRQIILRMVSDTGFRKLSEVRLVRALLGDGEGRFKLHARERTHPCYGRLEILGRDRVVELIKALISEGLISREESEYDGRAYPTLTITDQGAAELSRMG